MSGKSRGLTKRAEIRVANESKLLSVSKDDLTFTFNTFFKLSEPGNFNDGRAGPMGKRVLYKFY